MLYDESIIMSSSDIENAWSTYAMDHSFLSSSAKEKEIIPIFVLVWFRVRVRFGGFWVWFEVNGSGSNRLFCTRDVRILASVWMEKKMDICSKRDRLKCG